MPSKKPQLPKKNDDAEKELHKICIDVFQKYFECPTEKIQPNHLGLNYSKVELQKACDILEMENVLIRYPDLGYGDFNEYQVNSAFINAEREKVEKEQLKGAENYMHSLPRDFFSLFASACSEGFIENIIANNFDENKRTYNIRFNEWLKKKYNLSDDTLKVEGASINGVNGNKVAFKNPNTEYKSEYYTLNIFKEFLKDYYKGQKEIKQFFDKRSERNKIEVGLLPNPNTTDRIENTWVIENSKGMIFNPTTDFEKLKKTRLDLYEKQKKEFINERQERGLPITEFELNSFYVIWLEKEIKVADQWLSDTYPNGEKKKSPTASTQIEIKKYKDFVIKESRKLILDGVSADEKIKQWFAFIEYLNQYESEGIKFEFYIDKQRVIRSDNATFVSRTSNNSIVDTEMTERFYNRRWQERRTLFIEIDFIKDELAFLNTFHESTKKQFEAQFYPLLKLLKEKSERPRGKAKLNIYTPQKFEDLFINSNDVEICINALKKVEPPIIDNALKFQLGERQKGAIVAWLKVLRQRGKINYVTDEILSEILNKKIKGLNLSKDGRTLRNLKTTAYNKYYNTLLNLIT